MHIPSLDVLMTSSGKHVGGVFGFVKSIRSVLYEFKEVDRVACVFDAGQSKRRKKLLPTYKLRDKSDYDYIKRFRLQLGYLKFILPKLGIKVVVTEGKEGDDVVGLLADKIDSNLKIVVSDDRDMLQLVSENVQVWRPIAEELVTLNNFEFATGCAKKYWLLQKAILGDPSDKIPGILGIGAKTFDKFLKGCEPGDYPYEGFFEYCLDLSTKKSLSLVEQCDIVFRNIDLMDISLEKFEEEEVTEALRLFKQLSQFDILSVKRVFTSFEFFSLIKDFGNWITRFQVLR